MTQKQLARTLVEKLADANINKKIAVFVNRLILRLHSQPSLMANLADVSVFKPGIDSDTQDQVEDGKFQESVQEARPSQNELQMMSQRHCRIKGCRRPVKAPAMTEPGLGGLCDEHTQNQQDTERYYGDYYGKLRRSNPGIPEMPDDKESFWGRPIGEDKMRPEDHNEPVDNEEGAKADEKDSEDPDQLVLLQLSFRRLPQEVISPLIRLIGSPRSPKLFKFTKDGSARTGVEIDLKPSDFPGDDYDYAF